MHLPRTEQFLKEVVSQVRFPFDRNDIRMELQHHIMDKIDDYLEQGFSEDEAEMKSVSDMGDAKDLGRELNRQHNPFLGWLWKISNVLAGFAVFLFILMVVFPMLSTLFSDNPINRIPKNNIVYRLDINETVRLDDRVIKFTNLVYQKDGSMSIIYHYYNRKLFGAGWSLGTIGTITDNLGNTYVAGSGGSSAGIICRSIRTVNEFSPKASKLIICYDYYNRNYRVEIPLPKGRGENE